MTIRSFHFAGALNAQLMGMNGVAVGDFFTGHFAFSLKAQPASTTPTSATYPLASFVAGVPFVRLQPYGLSMTLETDPQSPSIQVFGQLPFGLYMGVLFRGGVNVVPNTQLPTTIDLSKFVIENFTICDIQAALFGFDQTGTPPPAARIFARGKIGAITVATAVPSV